MLEVVVVIIVDLFNVDFSTVYAVAGKIRLDFAPLLLHPIVSFIGLFYLLGHNNEHKYFGDDCNHLGDVENAFHPNNTFISQVEYQQIAGFYEEHLADDKEIHFQFAHSPF